MLYHSSGFHAPHFLALGIDVWLSPHVFIVVDSPFDLGLKLSTQKRVLQIS